MNISRRAWWLIVISAVYFLFGYYYLFVQRNDGMLILSQLGFCFFGSLPLWCKRIARFLHMRAILR